MNKAYPFVVEQCRALQSIALPQGYNGDTYNYFANCVALREVVIPDGLQVVASAMFFNCYGLQQITLPSSTTEIQSGSFTGNYGGLSSLTIKKQTPPTLDSSWIEHFGQLKEIIVPAGCGEAYKSATNWSYYADIIKEEED